MGQKSKKLPEMTKSYVCASTPYLSQHTSNDCVFCYTSLKWHLEILFSFLPNFGFLGCWGEGVKKAKNGLKWQNVQQKMPKGNSEVCPTFLICVIYLLNYDLICLNWSYQGQNYQNVPQIVPQWKIVTILFVLFYQFFFIWPSQYGLAFWKVCLWARSFL